MMLYRLPLIILVTGLLYIFIVPDEPLLFKLFFKVLPMGMIIYYGFRQLPKEKKWVHWLILTGLLFSAVGDVTLHWFLIGLSAFFIGHIFYCLGFFQQALFTKLRTAALLPIGVYAIIFALQLIPALQASGDHALILPVIAYIIVISLMLWSAVLTGNIFASCGSLLFVISDSILAWNKFIDPVGVAEPLIMLTYYGGQFLIATSLYSLVKGNHRIVW